MIPQERNDERNRGFDRILEQAAVQFGTPVYVIDAGAVTSAAEEVEAAFPAPWVRQYSLKANDLPAVMEILASRGWGANVVSSGEWNLARDAGADDSSVTFEGIGKTDGELALAAQSAARRRPLRWLALESQAEALQLDAAARAERLDERGLPLDVLLRLNPQVEPETMPELAVGTASSKFGMHEAEIVALVRDRQACAALRVRGIHVHVGSDLRDIGAWVSAGVQAVRLLETISAWAPHADTVDFGGGFPLKGSGGPSPAQFHDALAAALEEAGLDWPAVRAVEPGRYLVGAAGWLVTSVLHSRPRAPWAQQVVLDTGMTELIRPALYGSRHAMRAIALGAAAEGGGPGHRDLLDTSVEGPVCESTDSFGAHALPLLQRGDLVAIEGAGAYAASFTSRYNGRPHPPEVMAWPDDSLQLCDRAAIAAREAPTHLPSSHRLRSS